MARRIADIKRFSFAEMTSNSDGKTSASGTMGIFIVFIGGLVFLIGALGMIFKATDANILIQAVAMVYAGALLLGYRKSADKEISSLPEYSESPSGPDIIEQGASLELEESSKPKCTCGANPE